MKLTRDNALTLGLLGLLAVASFIAYLNAQAADPSRDHSTYRYNPTGTRALYTLLERQHVKVARHRRPLAEMPSDAASYWLVCPTTPLEGRDYEHLEDWVSEGHVLVIASSLGTEPIALGSAVAPLEGAWLSSALDRHFGVRAGHGGRPNAMARPVEDSPPAQGVRQVQLTGRTRLARVSAGMATHLRDPSGVTVASIGIGTGTIIFVTDPDIISNSRLDDADNALFCYNLARWRVPPGKVYFDEFHHGFSDAPTLGTALRRSSAGWGLYQAALALLVLVLGRTLRFGSPIPAFSRRRRSVLEYVRSVAGLYRAAGQRPAVLEMLYLDLRRQSVAQLGSSPGDSNADLGALLAARRGGDAAQVTATLNAVAAAARAAQIPEAELLRLAREIARHEGRRGVPRE